MNLFECIPASFSFNVPLYWAQAASLQMLPTSESFLEMANPCISSKSIPMDLTGALVKNQNTSVIEKSSGSMEESAPSFGISPLRLSTVMPYMEKMCQQEQLNFDHKHRHLQQDPCQRQHQMSSYHQRVQHPLLFSASSPPIGNGLAPLKALCDSDVSILSGTRSTSLKSVDECNERHRGLKFGIQRILSDDFGKFKQGKENNFLLNSIPESYRSLPLCPCNSPTCTALVQQSHDIRTPSSRKGLASLSAVHALQPPHYPFRSSVDALPGPYSILSTDPCSNSNQTKRKRSWSRAVFSNLQRKGLEKRFEQQKYVTKPDRRQLASMLGLTDAQVKVWFQNRRMKWRHSQQRGMKGNQAKNGKGTDFKDDTIENARSPTIDVSNGENSLSCVDKSDHQGDCYSFRDGNSLSTDMVHGQTDEGIQSNETSLPSPFTGTKPELGIEEVEITPTTDSPNGTMLSPNQDLSEQTDQNHNLKKNVILNESSFVTGGLSSKQLISVPF